MSFAFHSPDSLSECLALLDRYGDGAVIVNGGTDIVIDITAGRIAPKAAVYVANISELHGIRPLDGYTRIGGAATYREISSAPACQGYRGLMQAIDVLGSPPIRNVATAAGNIMTGAPAADCCTMLMALDALVSFRSVSGSRTVPLCELHAGRGKIAAAPNELLEAIWIPEANRRCAYSRLARRKAQDIAKVLIGVSLTLERDTIKSAHIALGALASVPKRAYSVERALSGKPYQDGIRILRRIFPEEVSLRESPFKEYKQLTLMPMIERTVLDAIGGDV